MEIYLTLKNDEIRKSKISDKDFICEAFLYFNKNVFWRTNTTLTDMCDIMHYNINSRSDRCNQEQFKDSINRLMNKKKIIITNNSNNNIPGKMSANKMITIELNKHLYGKEDAGFTILTLEEFKKIIKIANRYAVEPHRILNVYLNIKSYIYNDKHLIHIAYPSESTLCENLSCKETTLSEIINILTKENMIYSYDFMSGEWQNKKLYNEYKHRVHIVYSIKKYDINRVAKMFINHN